MSMFQMILAAVILGTADLLVGAIPMDPTMTAAICALIGALTTSVVMLLRRKAISRSAIMDNLGWLLLSGAALGGSWILMGLSKAYTASSGMSAAWYYTAPLLLMLVSPLFLKEKLTGLRVITALAASVGVVLMSGMTFQDLWHVMGILTAVGAAALFAAVVVINKVMKRVPAQEATFFQLIVAVVITMPYAFFVRGEAVVITAGAIVPMLILGALHTGAVYMLFFGALNKLSAQTAALMTYLTPVTTWLLITLLVTRKAELFPIIGAAMVLLSVFVGEVFTVKKRKKR